MLRVSAHAKINFYLEITGKRSDGYHTLSIVFQTISLSDTLTFRPADRLSLTCSDSALPTDESNLVMRAAVRIQKELKERRGARIHLKKVIPMGAGLGGGSSDAAAVLRNLPKLWGRRIGEPALRRLAVELGADVPFFLKGGLCSATGIGEKLKRLPSISRKWLVLVYPGFGVSTREAYAKVKLPFAGPQARRSTGSLNHLFNRFEQLIFPDHPELVQLKNRLLELGVTAALMSGSGSAIFGIMPSQKIGRAALAEIRRQYPQSWLVHTV